MVMKYHVNHSVTIPDPLRSFYDFLLQCRPRVRETESTLVCLSRKRHGRLRAGESTLTSASLWSSEELGTLIAAPLAPQTSPSVTFLRSIYINLSHVALTLHISIVIMSEKAGPGVGFEFPSFKVSWLKRDLLLFAASIGATYPDELHFLYVGHITQRAIQL